MNFMHSCKPCTAASQYKSKTDTCVIARSYTKASIKSTMTGEASAASWNQNISVEKVTVVDPHQRQVGESNLQEDFTSQKASL